MILYVRVSVSMHQKLICLSGEQVIYEEANPTWVSDDWYGW